MEILVPKFIMKSKNNVGESAKQSFMVIKSAEGKPALAIRRLTLTKDIRGHSSEKKLKEFRGYGLFETVFAINMDTLDSCMIEINRHRVIKDI